ncbi:hypothetical protein WI666_08785 [Vibrio cholerae]
MDLKTGSSQLRSFLRRCAPQPSPSLKQTYGSSFLRSQTKQGLDRLVIDGLWVAGTLLFYFAALIWLAGFDIPRYMPAMMFSHSTQNVSAVRAVAGVEGLCCAVSDMHQSS